MKCPECHSGQVIVIGSVVRVDGRAVCRRRKCEACGHRWNTIETVAEDSATRIALGQEPPRRSQPEEHLA